MIKQLKEDKRLKTGKSYIKWDQIKSNNILICRPSPCSRAMQVKNSGGEDLEKGGGETSQCFRTDNTTYKLRSPNRREGGLELVFGRHDVSGGTQ